MYGRMNSDASRPAPGAHNSSSPSKAKPNVRSANRRQSNDSDQGSDGLPTPRITRQASRNLALQQQQAALRRSPRLNPSLRAEMRRQRQQQQAIRRSARLARMGPSSGGRINARSTGSVGHSIVRRSTRLVMSTRRSS